MPDSGCTVTFDGTMGGEYYVACNLVEFIDEQKLYNHSNNNIILYPSIQQGNIQDTITLPGLSYPYYTSGSYRYYITNASNISFNFKSSFYRERSMVSIVLLSLVVTISLINRILGGKK